MTGESEWTWGGVGEPARLPAEVVKEIRRLRPPPRIDEGMTVAPVRVDPSGREGPTQSQARGPHWRRTAKGLYVPTDARFDQPDQRILEASTRLPEVGAVSGWACLHLAGARWFDGLEPDGRELPVALAVGPWGKRRDAEGITLWREQINPWQIVARRGIACRTIEAAVFDEMRVTHSLRRAVVVLEMAMFAELTSLRRFAAYVATRARRKWVGLAREALQLAQEGAESPQETRMRLVWVMNCGLPRPLCNVDVYDVNGTFLGRPDLLDPIAGVVGEYDGAHHRLAEVRARDVVREEAFRAAGLEYFTVVQGDLARSDRVAARMLRTRERALSRPTSARRGWTLAPPPGVAPPLSLDRRLELRELLQTMRAALPAG